MAASASSAQEREPVGEGNKLLTLGFGSECGGRIPYFILPGSPTRHSVGAWGLNRRRSPPSRCLGRRNHSCNSSPSVADSFPNHPGIPHGCSFPWRTYWLSHTSPRMVQWSRGRAWQWESPELELVCYYERKAGDARSCLKQHGHFGAGVEGLHQSWGPQPGFWMTQTEFHWMTQSCAVHHYYQFFPLW